MKTCGIGLFLLLAAHASALQAADLVYLDADSVVAYIKSCRKANGAFGPADQEYTDAAWNYPAVAALRALDEPLPQPDRVLQHGLGSPAGHVGYGHWQFFHYHGLRDLLGERIKPREREIRLVHQGWEMRYYGSPLGTDSETFFSARQVSQPDDKDVRATQLGWYNLASLYYVLKGLHASGRHAVDTGPAIAYLHRCQAPGGGFVDLRTAEAVPVDGDAHVAHTHFAVASLKLLGQSIPKADACVESLLACQRADGGFGYRPDSRLSGNAADVYYTWAAVTSLKLLGSEPQDEQACIHWINSLHNADGGFGDQPGWRSRLYSTYYAVDCLRLLTGDARGAITAKRVAPKIEKPIRDDGLRIYQALFKMPVCEPADLTSLHRRGFNLLAIKSDRLDIAERLRASIRDKQLPMDVVLCHEAYPHRLTRGGGAVLNHVGNFTLDSRWTDAQRTRWQQADSAGRRSLPWDEYVRDVLEPARQLHSVCYPEQDFEREQAMSAYDASLAGNGYNALLAGFNWSPRDFVRVFPWRERYVDRLTPIADCDAHGDLAKWSPQLDHTRNLFLARGPTYADFLEAAAAGRVVCAIANPEGVPSAVTLYGPRPAVDYVRERLDQWRWWE